MALLDLHNGSCSSDDDDDDDGGGDDDGSRPNGVTSFKDREMGDIIC